VVCVREVIPQSLTISGIVDVSGVDGCYACW
jgi:hypothetical protein